MPSAENCTACRFHKEIDQGTQNALAFCPPKVSDAVSLTAYLLYQTVFHLSRTFSKLFSKFLKQFFQNSNFSDRCLFRNSLFIISNWNPFVKNFLFFSNRFSVRPPRLSATALIEYHSPPPPVNKNFQVFFKFRNRDITPITSNVRKSILFMRQTPSRSPPWPVSVSQSHLSQPRFSLFS